MLASSASASTLLTPHCTTWPVGKDRHSRFFALRNSDLSRLSVTNAFFATNLLLTFDRFTRKGCPQLVHTDRLKWPVAKQWEQTFVKGIV